MLAFLGPPSPLPAKLVGRPASRPVTIRCSRYPARSATQSQTTVPLFNGPWPAPCKAIASLHRRFVTNRQSNHPGNYRVLSDSFRKKVPFPHTRKRKQGLNVLCLDDHADWMNGRPRANFK